MALFDLGEVFDCLRLDVLSNRFGVGRNGSFDDNPLADAERALGIRLPTASPAYRARQRALDAKRAELDQLEEAIRLREREHALRARQRALE